MAQNTGSAGGPPTPELYSGASVDTRSAMRKPKFGPRTPKRPHRDDFGNDTEYREAIRKWNESRPGKKASMGEMQRKALA